VLCTGSTLLLVQSYAPDEAPYKILWSCREASKHQPSEVGSFSYWFDKPWFHTEGRLAAVLIIPSSWGSQLGRHLHAIKQFFWRHCQGERGFLQWEPLASNLLLCYCFVLFYFCLHLFIEKYKKKLVHISSCFFMSSFIPITMSPEEMIFTFKQKSEESFKEAWSRIYDFHGKTDQK
jgi:hypothetical protein